MFRKTRKIIRYFALCVIFLALIFAYSNNRTYVNDILPIEDLGKNVWFGFKNTLSKLNVIPEYTPTFTVQKAPKQIAKEEDAKTIQKLDVEIEQLVVQKKAGTELQYGFDKNYNLVYSNNTQTETFFKYATDGFIEQIVAGNRQILFTYNPSRQLIKVTDEDKIAQFRYDFNGWLKSADYPYDQLLFLFDSLGHLMTFKRGVGYETKFTYDKGRLSAFVKDGTTTRLAYGAENRIKGAQTDDSYLVLNYGRDDFLAYLAGAKYGLGETISYNTNDESVVSATDDSVFTGATEPARINALNIYLACAKFKKLPVLFDPLAYALYVNYFKQDIVSYLVNNYVCDVVYERKV